MKRLNLIKRIGLILLGVAALIILLPLIILSLEVVLVTGPLLLIGVVGAKLPALAHHFHTWWGDHHWVFHRHSGPRLRTH